MSKGMLKTMAAIAAVAAFMLPGASWIAAAADAAPSAAAAPAPAMDEPGTRSFTLVAVEVNDTKFWLPSVIAVEQGDKVNGLDHLQVFIRSQVRNPSGKCPRPARRLGPDAAARATQPSQRQR